MLISDVLFFFNINKISILLNLPTRFRRAFISDNEAVQILVAEMAFRMRNHVPNEHRERLVGVFEHEREACNSVF